VPDGRNRYTAYERVLFVENADSGQSEGGFNGGLRVHGLIFPHATDILCQPIYRQRSVVASIKYSDGIKLLRLPSSVCRERDSNPHALSGRRF
jgi:hypothetical protein